MHLVKKYGAANGRADLAGMVKQDSSGALSVAPEHRGAVMGARKDLDLSAKLAARYCDECRAGLNRKLGRPPSETEVRMGYFLGVTGATRLINAAATTPDASIKSVSPAAYASNRAIFTAHGKPLTASQALVALERKFDAEIARHGGAPAPKPATNSLIVAMEAAQTNEAGPA
jgi:hypothetical protein